MCLKTECDQHHIMFKHSVMDITLNILDLSATNWQSKN